MNNTYLEQYGTYILQYDYRTLDRYIPAGTEGIHQNGMHSFINKHMRVDFSYVEILRHPEYFKLKEKEENIANLSQECFTGNMVGYKDKINEYMKECRNVKPVESDWVLTSQGVKISVPKEISKELLSKIKIISAPKYTEIDMLKCFYAHETEITQTFNNYNGSITTSTHKTTFDEFIETLK